MSFTKPSRSPKFTMANVHKFYGHLRVNFFPVKLKALMSAFCMKIVCTNKKNDNFFASAIKARNVRHETGTSAVFWGWGF